MVRRLAFLCLLSAVALAAPRQKTLSAELTGAALLAYEQGKWLFSHSDFGTAHAKFKQAFDASKNPRLLWNMAACSAKQKRYALAIDEAERHLALGRGALAAEQVEKGNAFLTEVRGYVAEATFHVTPPGATLTVDRVARGVVEAAAPVYLEVGVHEVVLEREGFEPFRDNIAVHEVGRSTFTFALTSRAAAAAAPVAPVATAVTVIAQPAVGPAALTPQSTGIPSAVLGVEPTPAPEGVRRRTVAGWSMFGVGVAAIGGGLFEHLASRAAASDFKAACQGMDCDPSARPDHERATTAATVATSLYVGGALLVGAGAVILWTAGPDAPPVEVVATPRGVRVGGSF